MGPNLKHKRVHPGCCDVRMRPKESGWSCWEGVDHVETDDEAGCGRTQNRERERSPGCSMDANPLDTAFPKARALQLFGQ